MSDTIFFFVLPVKFSSEGLLVILKPCVFCVRFETGPAFAFFDIATSNIQSIALVTHFFHGNIWHGVFHVNSKFGGILNNQGPLVFTQKQTMIIIPFFIPFVFFAYFFECFSAAIDAIRPFAESTTNVTVAKWIF